ncbi:SpaA isopeptide-forming pilin-related protein [Enterococcus hulanensis]|uniref:SpaA isopeptide-forming pilin-related protein n=1 Tax=Enterococcus hulanensis TaxID=2559929 RepID=UPI0010F9FA1A|nr:SpaA isopeptide-forming pilin-related protein [Enterococcus hulanensis]
MNEKQKKYIIAILLFIVFFGGVIIIVGTSIGTILHAAEETLLFQVENEEGIQIENDKTKKESEILQLTANEMGLYELPYDESFIVEPLNKEKEAIAISAFSKEEISKQDIVTELLEKEATSSEENGSKNSYGCIQVKENEGKGKFYFDLSKGLNIWIRIQRNEESKINVTISDFQNTERNQLLLQFESNQEILNESISPERKKEAVFPSESRSNQETKENNETNSDGKYESISKVETKETNKSLKELTEESYEVKDSLKTPLYFGENEFQNIDSEFKGESDPIIVREAKLSVKTGTKNFDPNDSPGNDSSEDNSIVRSFDQVSYLLSFSIQNTTLTNKYTNIRYRVKARMSNAIEIKDGNPKNNGEIANGTNIANEDSSEYSEGVMESTISDTGQLFVPIIMNVFSADHGDKLQPSIILEIVDAKNVSTGETETINKEYTSEQLKQLEPPITTVSAKPSVAVKLVKGNDASGKVILSDTDSLNQATLDIAAVTVLQPLALREAKDFRGSMFPKGKISYQIKGKGFYEKGGTTTYLSETGYNSVSAAYYSPSEFDRVTAPWEITPYGSNNNKITSKNFRPQLISNKLQAPNANTGTIFTSQPVNGLSEIGVYNSGSFNVRGSYTTDIENTGYARVYNPYTYSMQGTKYGNDTKPFSSLEILYHWDKTRWQSDAKKNGWVNYGIEFSVDKISYDGITTSLESKIKYSENTQGWYEQAVVVKKFLKDKYKENGILDGSDGNAVSLDIGTDSLSGNTGQAHVQMGERLYLTGIIVAHSAVVRETEQMLVFNSNTFKYDGSRRTEDENALSLSEPSATQFFGVAKKLSDESPPLEFGTIDAQKELYIWYDSYKEAESKGKISAVLLKRTYSPARPMVMASAVPFTVIGNPGSTDSKGKPNVVLSLSKVTSSSGLVHYRPQQNKNHKYSPTVFDANGNRETPHSMNNGASYAAWGTSVFVESFGISTSTDVKEPTYETSDEVEIKIRGDLAGSSSVDYNGSLSTILPKGVSYKSKTSKDAMGKVLPEPSITKKPDGTTLLKWSFTDMPLTKGVEVNFKVTNNIGDMSFEEDGISTELTVKTIGEMWKKSDSSVKDGRPESMRSSKDSYNVKLNQKVILSKSADKTNIEVGDNDPLLGDTSITYKVLLVNETVSPISNVWLKDVLPYDGDSRNSSFKGSYNIEEIKVDSISSVNISYKNESLDENADPRNIKDGIAYVPGTTPVENIKKAKSIWFHMPKMVVGEKVTLTIRIRLTNQKPGDVLINNSTMNSDLDLQVTSQPVRTTVYGRDLTGYVWYDDDYDGLIGNKLDGTSEDSVSNIPVKLYRTSQSDPKYKDQPVKESLTGEAFIDDSGNSLIKTGSDGKYKFENLPEGEYVAEFMVGDIVVTRKVAIVTEPLKGTGEYDPLNSKADPNTFKTPEKNEAGDPFYVHPELKDLPAILTGTDKVQHITDVNAGLTRLSKIRLFKYEEGTVIDADGDGKLSDEEIEASTTNALEGAEFQLYKGKSDDPNTIKDENKVGTVKVTDEHGWLEFESLPPGFYTIVETKAPAGFELLKNPIEVEVPTYNYIAIVHVPDSAQTKLPFTGSTKAMRIILIAAAVLMVVGMTGVFLHFRPINVRGGK